MKHYSFVQENFLPDFCYENYEKVKANVEYYTNIGYKYNGRRNDILFFTKPNGKQVIVVLDK